jgi:acetyl esterase
MHGGGWILGTIEAHDALCRALCNAAGSVVASVDYRLAPEHPFPRPVEDCETALRWARSHAGELGVDPARVAVAGDSAGGNLATVLARRARDAGEPVQFQLLVYPPTDAALATASMADLGGGGYALTRDEMRRCWDLYAGANPARSPDLSPLRAPDLGGMPPALVICAELDPLTDEATAYAERLSEAGVTVRLSEYPGMVHGFFRWRGGVDAAHDAMAEAGAALRAVLSPERDPARAPAAGPGT